MKPYPDALSAMAERLGWTLLHSIWQGAAIAALLCVTLWLLRRQSAALRHAICLLAMVAALAATIVTFAHSSPRTKPAINGGNITQIHSLLDAPPFAEELPVKAAAGSVSHSSPPAGAKPSRDAQPISTRIWTSWRPRFEASLPWLSSFWIAGVLLLSLRHFGGWWRLHTMRSRAVPGRTEFQKLVNDLKGRFACSATVRLLESAEAISPMLAGLFKPVILLPLHAISGLSLLEIEAILAHELAHLARRDAWSNLAQVTIETIFFYHPAIWWIGNRTREEREHAADDLALQVCTDRHIYADALFHLAEARSTPALTLAATGGNLLNRIRRIVQPTAFETVTADWSIALPSLCIALAMLTIWVSHVHADDSQVITVVAGQSLQAAIDAAPAHATIHIGPGQWKERLALNKPLTLEGAGWDKTTIIPDQQPAGVTVEAKAAFRKRITPNLSAEERAKLIAEWTEKYEHPALKIYKTDGVTIRKLRISDSSASTTGQSVEDFLVEFRNAKAVIEDCAIVGPFSNGIDLTGESSAEVRRSLVAALWNEGILVEGPGVTSKASSLHLADSEVRNVYHYGISIGRGCDDTVIERCRISGTAWHGIRYDDASPTITGNTIFGNARMGIYASGTTHATVRGNLFWKNEMAGVSCWTDNQDKIEGNTFAGNLRSGLEVLGGSKPNVVHNLFVQNPTAIGCAGIANRDGSVSPIGAPVLTSNAFWQNKVAIQDGKDEKPAPDGSLSADPQFRDAAKADFALASASPARAANTGAPDPLTASGETYPLLAEEKSMIPDSDTRDYNAWKKPGTSPSPKPAEKAPANAATATPAPSAETAALQQTLHRAGLASQLQGLWVLCGTPEKPEEPPKAGGRMKFFGNGIWTLTQSDPSSGKEIFHHGGIFSLFDDEYLEKVQYANESTADLVGKVLRFNVKIEGDTLIQKGIGNDWNELWKRVKPEPGSLQEKLQGVWILAGTPEKPEVPPRLDQGLWMYSINPNNPAEPPKSGPRLKFFGNGIWTLTELHPASKDEIFHHGGTYSLSDGQYAEKVEYANKSTADLVGKTFKFSMKIDGDTLIQKGIGNEWNEVWKRVK